jgi:catechol 2,3-dioxygenase-like lactoylglutathione lyase family enzyme
MTVATKPIPPVFAPTGWKTVGLDHITWQVADHHTEAAFYVALMGWTLRSEDDQQAVLDIGNWGTAVFKKNMTPAAAPAAAPATGRGRVSNATVQSFGLVIAPWNAKTVKAELEKRGLAPVEANDGHGFESFLLKDPDGLAFQIGNGGGYTKARQASAATAKPVSPAPFDSPGWKTVWLDHFSYGTSNYKLTASFFQNLLGWGTTYDEGSQNEMLIGDVGDAIVRGPNANDPAFGQARGRNTGIDHISFGITPWDTDGVKDGLEKRGLRAQVDTSTKDEIHVAAFKSYHTQTPNGYNLQISAVTHDARLTLSNAVRPKSGGL